MRSGREEEVTRLYEEMRSYALSNQGDAPVPMGLSLIMKYGTAAWVKAWSECTSCTQPEPPKSIPGVKAPIDGGHQCLDLTMVLANMTFLNLKGN